MRPNTPLSSYLVKPRLTNHRPRQWQGFRSRVFEIKRVNPHIFSRMLVGLLVWGAFSASFNYVTGTHELPEQASIIGNEIKSLGSTTTPDKTAVDTVTKAKSLPGGPSGQLLPPGTMATDKTYANNYKWGNCTWYVAGRRPIPNGWGNAKNWYYNAVSSGWKVGTTPAVAAVAWTSVGYYGHVALVESISTDGKRVYVSEMNYRGVGVKSFRWAAASSFKYIY